MKILTRLIATIVSILIYGWANYLLNPISTLAAGKIAGKQFEISDTSYVVSTVGMNFFSHLGIPFVILLAVIAAIWWSYIRKLGGPAAAILVVGLCITPSAQAYYDKSDYAEPFFVLPNESAFYIPNVGDNKADQARFNSEAYLRESKIPARLFMIPHTKLEGSGLFTNFYATAGRLIVVDRKPFNKSWVSATDRGTSSKNEGFPLQSKEGLNITVGISIGTSVTEDDCPHFLYIFGVKPPGGNRADPQVIFTSIYYGYSLGDVMDGIVHEKVHALLSAEFTSRTFESCNIDASIIMDNVKKNLETWLKSVGITLTYIGWADTFTFDKEVQSAINRRFIATQDKLVAEQLAPYTSVIQSLAAAEALRSFGEKTDGKLPTTIVGLPTGVGGLLSTLLNPAPAAPAHGAQAPVEK